MSDTAFDIEGGNNQILPAAQEASQYFIGDSAIKAVRQPSGVQHQTSAVIRHYITHDAVGVPQLIRQARHRIVFHAAYYPKYGFDQQGKDLWSAMEDNSRLLLTAIFADVDHVAWTEEFGRVLRPFYTAKDFKDDLEASKRHFVRCLSHFGSKRVRILDTPRLPLFPAIMIDDTLIIGHYAHSREITPDGLWLTIHHPKIRSMYECLLAGGVPECETPEERAILRYVEELIV